MNTYILTETTVNIDNTSEITTYGIALNHNSIYNDISPNKTFVMNIIEKCNNHNVSPVHIQDVIYDSICTI